MREKTCSLISTMMATEASQTRNGTTSTITMTMASCGRWTRRRRTRMNPYALTKRTGIWARFRRTWCCRRGIARSWALAWEASGGVVPRPRPCLVWIRPVRCRTTRWGWMRARGSRPTNQLRSMATSSSSAEILSLSPAISTQWSAHACPTSQRTWTDLGVMTKCGRSCTIRTSSAGHLFSTKRNNYCRIDLFTEVLFLTRAKNTFFDGLNQRFSRFHPKRISK